MKKTKPAYQVNLPKTKFPMKGDLPHNEPRILSLWKKLNIYKKLQEKNLNHPKFILHDGPPYANGHIHCGHVVNKVLKDFVIKYRLMTGNCAPFIPGWDCHGLPIEHQLMKERHLTKHSVSLVDFRREAAQYAQKFINIQREEFIRLGAFGEWDNPYLTMDPQYEKVIVQCFHALLKKGFVYRRKKPVLWCAVCETALAEAEVEYEEHESPSIYVAFPVIRKGKAREIKSFSAVPEVSLVIWTTTPWTIPANVAIALKPGRQYIFLKKDGSQMRYLVESSLWEKEQETFTKRLGLKHEENDPPPVRAEELLDVECRHPFMKNMISRVIIDDFVDVDTGTGAVHIAPGHGEEDYAAGLKFNLPIFSPVDHAGKFTHEVELCKGMKVFDANSTIIQFLKEEGVLLYSSTTVHSYPHCWRCRNPIIFRATEQWFLSIEHMNLRNNILENIKHVEWIPPYGEARIRGMVESRPDWCLSRQRYWGTPITVFYCSACGEPLIDEKVMHAIEERIGTEGTIAWFTAPESDFFHTDVRCSHCDSKTFHKERDILDVWFDSGVSHKAVLKGNPRVSWPADLYLEGSDQYRGWFQTSIVPAVALEGRAPYRAVLIHGFTVDGEGKKMSKSRGNVVAPEKIINDHGADILRLWVAASDYRVDIRISPEIIRLLVDVYRRIRNTLRFLLGNIHDFMPSRDSLPYEQMLEIDRWALHRLQRLVQEVHARYGMYEFHRVWKALNTFCAVDMSAVYFDILKDRLYTWHAQGTHRRSAQTALFNIVHELSRLVAPLLSFTAEEAWQVLKEEHPDIQIEESVFLAGLPKINSVFVSEKLEHSWQRLFSIRDQVNIHLEKKRQEGAIRSSLEAEVEFSSHDKGTIDFLNSYLDILDMILIVSKVTVSRGEKKDIPDTLSVTVRKAPGEKCPRCWRWQEDVSVDTHLCRRCQDVINLGTRH